MGVAVGTDGYADAGLDVREALASILRGSWIVVLSVVLAGAGAFAYVQASPTLYTSTAEVLVLPVLSTPLRPAVPVNMDTETRMVTSAQVTRAVLRDLDDPAFSGVRNRLTVTPIEDTEILAISFIDADPALAQRVADLFAIHYLDARAEQASGSVEQYVGPLEQRIATLDGKIEALAPRIARLDPESARWQSALELRSDLEARRLALIDQLAPLFSLSVDPGMVVRAAEIPPAPSSPRRQFTIAVGATLGLLVGIAGAYLWGGWRRRPTEPAPAAT